MKKSFVFIGLLFYVILFTGACGKADQARYWLGTDMIKYNIQGFNEFGFNLNYVSSSQDDALEFLGFTGEGLGIAAHAVVLIEEADR